MELNKDFCWLVVITSPDGGLEGILIKFADVKKVGEVVTVSGRGMKIPNYFKNWTKKVRFFSMKNRQEDFVNALVTPFQQGTDS